MTLDPQAQAVIDAVRPRPARRMGGLAGARVSTRLYAGPEVAAIENRSIPGPDGDVPVRMQVYSPFWSDAGWVIWTWSQPQARHLCKGAGCVVVSVDYRLSPETKFPGPAEDCYAATPGRRQRRQHRRRFPPRRGRRQRRGQPGSRISLMAADRNGPAIVHQLLVTRSRATTRPLPMWTTPTGYMLARDAMQLVLGRLPGQRPDASNPYAAPMQADSLAGQPSALVITAEYDPLRDEGEAYGRRLQEAGVGTTISRYDGMIHGFFGMVGIMDKSGQVMEEATAALRAAFVGTSVPAPADD